MEFILALLVSILGVGLGLIVLFLFSIAVKSSINYDKALNLECELRNSRMGINSQMISLLYEIGTPDLPSGGYSDAKLQLWETYYQMNEEYERRFKQDFELVWNTRYG